MLFHLEQKKPLVDVRPPGEYSGHLLYMPDYPQEGALRGGHIPGARIIPWARAVQEDGTLKPAVELLELYQSQGIRTRRWRRRFRDGGVRGQVGSP